MTDRWERKWMVWQHDKVNRLMDHQTNVGGGRRRIAEEKSVRVHDRRWKIA